MEKSVSYHSPLTRDNSNSTVSYWYLSTEAFDKKDFKNSLINLIKYIDSTIQIPNNSGTIEIKVPHGSVEITIKIDSDSFSVKAPFLKNPEGATALGLMRQISELNFSYLVLGQIFLEGTDFYFYYTDKLENAEPYKAYAIFEEICFCADYYDDVFMDKFKTTQVNKPQINSFSPEEKENAWKYFQEIIKEASSFVEYFDSRRFYGLSCDALETAVLKLDYAISPQGLLGTKLSEVKSALYAQDSLQNISANGKQKLLEMLNYDRNKFNDDLFHPKFFIPIRKRAELPYILSFFQKNYETITSDMSSKAYMAASSTASFMIYDLLYKNTIPNDIRSFLTSALEKGGGKDWKTSAEVLYGAIHKIMQLDPESNEPIQLGDGSSQNISVKSIFGKITGLFKK